MNTLQKTTLRPGLLVSLKTSLVGNVSYRARTIEEEHRNEDGAQVARWETERTITDPEEHEAAKKARSKATAIVRAVCAYSAFGLLCPEDKAAALESAVAEARATIEAFNDGARLSRVQLYVITGRIAPDDVEAVRAINSEVAELMATMKDGIDALDVKAVREAASRAKGLGSMLTPAAAARVEDAVAAARSVARKITKAGETAALAIDKVTLARITDARTAFLDLDDAKEIQAPTVEGRALDLFDDSTLTQEERDAIDEQTAAESAAVAASYEETEEAEAKPPRPTTPQFEID